MKYPTSDVRVSSGFKNSKIRATMYTKFISATSTSSIPGFKIFITMSSCEPLSLAPWTYKGHKCCKLHRTWGENMQIRNMKNGIDVESRARMKMKNLSYGSWGKRGWVNIFINTIYWSSQFFTQDCLDLLERDSRSFIKTFLKFLNILFWEQRGCWCYKLEATIRK